MINVKLQISELEDGNVELRSSGGNFVRSSEVERDFTKKLLTHINQFNSVYEKLHTGNHIRMRAKRKKR